VNPDRRPGTAVRDVAEPVEGDRTGQTETTAAAPRRRLRLPTGARSPQFVSGTSVAAARVAAAAAILRRRRPTLKPDQAAVALETTARGRENLVPRIVDAVEAAVTLGEICDRLRGVFGVHQPSVTF